MTFDLTTPVDTFNGGDDALTAMATPEMRYVAAPGWKHRRATAGERSWSRSSWCCPTGAS